MASPNFNSRQPVTPGECVTLSPKVARVVAGNASPYTFTGTASYIVGTKSVAIIDPGPDEDDHLAALMAAIGERPVSHILITHTHLDHTALVPRLAQATGAPTFGFGAHGSGRAPRLDLAPSGDAGADASFEPQEIIEDGAIVEGEDWCLQAIHTPGHTSNHLCFSLDDEAALFSGDHVMGWSTTMVAPPDGHMGDYMASLRLLQARKDQTYWPGHGGPIEQPRRFIRALVSHREAREQAFVKRLRQGDRTVGSIVDGIYSELEGRLKRAAALNTLSHLLDLIDRGEVRAEGPLGLDAEFYLED